MIWMVKEMAELQMSIYDFTRLASLLGILIIMNVFLNQWEPKIKQQYIATFILATGLLTGFFIANSMVFGFVTAGFVIFGESMMSEINKLKDCFKILDKTIDKEIEKNVKIRVNQMKREIEKERSEEK